jgi:hypothetical protein
VPVNFAISRRARDARAGFRHQPAKPIGVCAVYSLPQKTYDSGSMETLIGLISPHATRTC